VVDPPRADPSAAVLRTTLVLATGLIGGLALGVALLLGRALTSSRLYRRDEVGLALGAPVAVSVGRLADRRRWAWPVRLLRRLIRRRDVVMVRGDVERRRLARAIERHFPARGWRQRLVVGCIDNAAEVAQAVVEMAAAARERGGMVHLVDLTERGVLAAAVAEHAESHRGGSPDDGSDDDRRPLDVLRPADVPSLSEGPRELSAATESDIAQLSFPSAGHKVLVLADLHPAVGADHLPAWTERVIVAVTSGRSNAERVLACGRMLRGAGLDVVAAVLLRADPTDESCGQPEREPVTGHLEAGQRPVAGTTR
jgi:hypothetical protein